MHVIYIFCHTMKKTLLLGIVLLMIWTTSAKLLDEPAVVNIQQKITDDYDFTVTSHLLQDGDSCVDSTDFAQCLRNQDSESELIFVFNEKLNKLDANTREDISVILPRTETLRLEQFASVYISKGDIASWYVAYIESVWESLQKICDKNKLENCTSQTMQWALQKKYTRQWNILTRLNRLIYIFLWVIAVYLIYQAYFAKRKRKINLILSLDPQN